MMGKPMKAQTESIDPVLNNTDYISKFKKIALCEDMWLLLCVPLGALRRSGILKVDTVEFVMCNHGGHKSCMRHQKKSR